MVHHVFVDFLASHLVDFVVAEGDSRMSNFGGVDVHDVRGDDTSCEFADHDGGTFQRIDADVGVAATLEAEGGVSLESVTFGSFADADGVEVGAFQKQSLGVVGNTRIESAIYTTDAQAALGVAYHQVVLAQLDLVAVQGGERSAFRQVFHDDFAALDFVSIECVHRLPDFEHDVLGDIHHIVDGTHTDGFQVIL